MVCCQEIREDHEFELWKDFPKGLRVLLLCDGTDSASQTQAKLEQMDYIVSWCSSFQALEALSEKSEYFHVAILEVTPDNCQHSFKFLQAACDLPVIVISSDSSLSTMMKCIALGAAEFLQKPLSEDKLRNIWQHVIYKAFNSRKEFNTTVTSLKHIKEMVASMFDLNQGEKVERSEKDNPEKLNMPSTPQLESKLRISSTNQESEERNIKSVERTGNDSIIAPSKSKNEVKELTKHEEEVNSVEISKNDACSSVKKGHDIFSLVGSKKKKNGSSSQASKVSKKKTKVDWTPELHKRFVKAVEQLGIDQAIPSKILDLMKVEGLTRHNIASHLQKYRMHRRHILPKEEERRWRYPEDINTRSYMQRPIVAPYPPFHQYYTIPPFSSWYHHQNYYCRPYQPWNAPAKESWPWQSYPGVHADTWGCPVFPPYAQCHIPSPVMPPPICDKCGTIDSSSGFSLDEEVVDKVVKEAMAKPWAPLPLGLTPPSTELVLSELHRLGIHTVPRLPTTQRTNHTLS